MFVLSFFASFLGTLIGSIVGFIQLQVPQWGSESFSIAFFFTALIMSLLGGAAGGFGTYAGWQNELRKDMNMEEETSE